MKDFPPSSILVSYDFSARCREAWDAAQAMARRFNARMQAVHVRDWLSPAGAPVRGSLTAAIREKLEAAMAEQLPGAPRAGCRVLEGASVEGILSAAREGSAGLVVVVSDRRGACGSVTLGSPCDELSRECPVPVLTIRGRMEAVRSVLAPVDLSQFSEKAAAVAADAAAALGAKLTLLNVSAGGLARKSAAARLHRFVASLPEPLRAAVSPSVEVVDAAAARRLAERSSEDTIVVLAAPTAPAAGGALGATAELLLRFSGAAVLTVPGAA